MFTTEGRIDALEADWSSWPFCDTLPRLDVRVGQFGYFSLQQQQKEQVPSWRLACVTLA